ncbi:MAG TPA: nicotinate-nucleotide--dimethylbenzimidazole phosphoribosyltransferase [Acidimicrobiales bacterium]
MPARARNGSDLPVDAVVIAANAAVDPPTPEPGATPRTAPGVGRLADALAGAGVAVHVLAPHHQGGGADRALAAHLAAAGLGPDRATVVGADAAVAGATRARTLVVTRCPEMAAGMTAAGHPVVVEEGRSAHQAVHGWLAGRAGAFAASAALVAPPDGAAAAAARAHHGRLTKPPGSLGRLEELGALLAGIAGESPPPAPEPAVAVVFAGDHGVHGQGVSPWPREVTAQMVANILAGGAAIDVLARQVGAGIAVVDVGVAGDVAPPPGSGSAGPHVAPQLIGRKVRRGTGDLSTGPAMTRGEARRALDAGAEVAALLAAGGARCLVTGDMGIANTTPAAALVACLTDRPAARVTGRGAGVDDQGLTRKTALVAAAVARARYEHGTDPLAVLAEIGGLEHAALAGFLVGAAALQVPVVVDGAVAASALLVASRVVPGVERCVIAGHRADEPASAAVLDELGIEPVLDLGMRLGEGTGAVLALPVVASAARLLHEMATFDQAGVTPKA